jgi:pimeloyl-ACP methyl ester carboxylesterase
MQTDKDAVIRGYARTPRGQLHYAETGEGPPLLLFSATPRTHRCFLPLMSLLAPHFRAIAVDMPGFGNSHALPSPLSMPALAACMADFMDAIHIEKAHVFGLHTGNKLAAALAAQSPNRIDRLILAGQSHSIIPDMHERNAAIQVWFDKYKTYYEPDAAGAHLVRDWLGAQANMNAIWWPAKLLNGKEVTPADIANAEARAIDFIQGWRSAVPVYEAVFAFDLAGAYRRIAAPTLVLELRTRGEAAIAGQAEKVCALIADSRPASLVEADGLALEYRPMEFAGPVLDFLGA